MNRLDWQRMIFVNSYKDKVNSTYVLSLPQNRTNRTHEISFYIEDRNYTQAIGYQFGCSNATKLYLWNVEIQCGSIATKVMKNWTAEGEYMYTFVNLDDNPKTLNITVVQVEIPTPPPSP